MPIEDCMKSDVISIDPDRSVREAALLMVNNHIGTLPVVTSNRQLVGLLTVGDLLQLFMPDFVALLDEINFVHDFGELEEHKISAESTQQTVRSVMHEPIAVTRDSGLLRAFTEIRHHNLLDIPVVDADNQLVGIVSRTDIGTLFLARWLGPVKVDRTRH